MERGRFETSYPEIKPEESAPEKGLSPEQLLEIGDPLELRKKLNDFLKESDGNETILKELTEVLSSLEEKMQSEGNGSEPLSHIFDLGRIEHIYDTTVVKKKKIPFASFLQEYIKNSIKILSDKFAKYVEASELNRALKESEQKKTQGKEAIEIVAGETREEIIQEMENRMTPVIYSPEDRQKINDFENKIKAKNRHTDSEQREFLGKVLEQEFILGKILEEENLFGENASVYHTSKFDDYFNHADLSAPTEENFQILIDLTYSQADAGEKLNYNRQRPVRNLSYPFNPEMSGKSGLPIIIGMTETDAEESINMFLRNTAKEKIGAVYKIASEQSAGSLQKNLERWFEYVLVQLKYQRDYIQEHLEERNKKREPTDNFKKAVELYDKAIDYFEELKKERHSRASLSEQRPWDKKFSNIEKTIEEFLIRSGLADKSRPAPDLSVFSAS